MRDQMMGVKSFNIIEDGINVRAVYQASLRNNGRL